MWYHTVQHIESVYGALCVYSSTVTKCFACVCVCCAGLPEICKQHVFHCPENASNFVLKAQQWLRMCVLDISPRSDLRWHAFVRLKKLFSTRTVGNLDSGELLLGCLLIEHFVCKGGPLVLQSLEEKRPSGLIWQVNLCNCLEASA